MSMQVRASFVTTRLYDLNELVATEDGLKETLQNDSQVTVAPQVSTKEAMVMAGYMTIPADYMTQTIPWLQVAEAIKTRLGRMKPALRNNQRSFQLVITADLPTRTVSGHSRLVLCRFWRDPQVDAWQYQVQLI